jgi:hypothetical protein
MQKGARIISVALGKVQIGRSGLGGRLGSSPFAALIAQLPRHSLVPPSENTQQLHRQHNLWTAFTWIHCTLSFTIHSKYED